MGPSAPRHLAWQRKAGARNTPRRLSFEVHTKAARRLKLFRVPSAPIAEAFPCNLSAREAEVLRLLSQGIANAEIAARLTVIYAKLGSDGHVAAIRRPSPRPRLSGRWYTRPMVPV